MLRPASLTISSALVVSRWQWMSIVNHLPRACTGPGKRPGICAPSGRQVNSIASPSSGFAHPTHLAPGRRGRETRLAAGRAPMLSPYHANAACWRAMIGRAAETIRKLSETARAARVPGLPMVLDVLEWAYGCAVQGVPGLDGAEELAATYAGRCATTDEAVATLIAWQSGKAGVAGFVTGCGGAIAMPIAMPAILLSTLYIQLRLVAAIAHLRVAIRRRQLLPSKPSVARLAVMHADRFGKVVRSAIVQVRRAGGADAP